VKFRLCEQLLARRMPSKYIHTRETNATHLYSNATAMDDAPSVVRKSNSKRRAWQSRIVEQNQSAQSKAMYICAGELESVVALQTAQQPRALESRKPLQQNLKRCALHTHRKRCALHTNLTRCALHTELKRGALAKL
jgi:hypothetical protein